MRFDITQIIDRHIQIHSHVACDVIPLPLTICAIICAPSITHLLILISPMSSLILFYSLKCYQLPDPSILTSKISSSPSIQNYFFSFQSSFFLIIWYSGPFSLSLFFSFYVLVSSKNACKISLWKWMIRLLFTKLSCQRNVSLHYFISLFSLISLSLSLSLSLSKQTN